MTLSYLNRARDSGHIRRDTNLQKRNPAPANTLPSPSPTFLTILFHLFILTSPLSYLQPSGSRRLPSPPLTAHLAEAPRKIFTIKTFAPRHRCPKKYSRRRTRGCEKARKKTGSRCENGGLTFRRSSSRPRWTPCAALNIKTGPRD